MKTCAEIRADVLEKCMEQIYVQTEDLSVGYNGKILLSDIAMQVKPGEILVLIGPNGAGKSTILKNIIREMHPIGGNIYIKDKKIGDYTSKEYAKTMSVVLTEKIKTEMMTCRDVVAMGRYPYTNYFGKLTKEDEKIVNESLEKVSAADIADKDFSQISDGQRQRIMLARAICQKPEIIVLDEPTSFLDIRHKIELLDILQEMTVKDNVAVIVSLHEIELAAKLADYVMCIGADRSIRFARPENIFTDEYISSLYGLTQGSYNSLYGSAELKKPEGKPHVFVLGGAGSGIYTYRELQRMGIAFTAGIIYENDCDYPIARALAMDVVSNAMFEPVSRQACERACQLIDESEYVIDTGCHIGSMNRLVGDVLEYAYRQKKKVLVKPDREQLRALMKI